MSDERWFDDYVPGTTSEHGPLRVAEDDVVDFGRRFDPQPFHVDAEAAAAGPFGGLIASGWHTCALVMRLLAVYHLAGLEPRDTALSLALLASIAGCVAIFLNGASYTQKFSTVLRTTTGRP